MTPTIVKGTRTALLAALLAAGALATAAPPARAMQILEAADHGELAAEISATGVSRIALSGDRVRRVCAGSGRLRGRARSAERRPLLEARRAGGRAGGGIRAGHPLHR